MGEQVAAFPRRIEMPDDLVADVERIADPASRRVMERLLNLIDALQAENQALREENQRLRDEVARLTGQSARPTFPARRGAGASRDHASERERHTPVPRQRQTKLDRIVVDRIVELTVDPATLPPDAQRKGWVETTIQDVVFRTDTVVFRRE